MEPMGRKYVRNIKTTLYLGMRTKGRKSLDVTIIVIKPKRPNKRVEQRALKAQCSAARIVVMRNYLITSAHRTFVN